MIAIINRKRFSPLQGRPSTALPAAFLLLHDCGGPCTRYAARASDGWVSGEKIIPLSRRTAGCPTSRRISPTGSRRPDPRGGRAGQNWGLERPWRRLPSKLKNKVSFDSSTPPPWSGGGKEASTTLSSLSSEDHLRKQRGHSADRATSALGSLLSRFLPCFERHGLKADDHVWRIRRVRLGNPDLRFGDPATVERANDEHLLSRPRQEMRAILILKEQRRGPVEIDLGGCRDHRQSVEAATLAFDVFHVRLTYDQPLGRLLDGMLDRRPADGNGGRIFRRGRRTAAPVHP